MRLDAPQELLLALGLVALGLRAVPALGGELLEALLDDRQVGDGELEIEIIDIAPRLGRCGGGRVVERAGDVEEGVRVADQREDVGIDRALRAAPAGMATSTYVTSA